LLRLLNYTFFFATKLIWVHCIDIKFRQIFYASLDELTANVNSTKWLDFLRKTTFHRHKVWKISERYLIDYYGTRERKQILKLQNLYCIPCVAFSICLVENFWLCVSLWKHHHFIWLTKSLFIISKSFLHYNELSSLKLLLNVVMLRNPNPEMIKKRVVFLTQHEFTLEKK
jgi:hypothetical protein